MFVANTPPPPSLPYNTQRSLWSPHAYKFKHYTRTMNGGIGQRPRHASGKRYIYIYSPLINDCFQVDYVYRNYNDDGRPPPWPRYYVYFLIFKKNALQPLLNDFFKTLYRNYAVTTTTTNGHHYLHIPTSTGKEKITRGSSSVASRALRHLFFFFFSLLELVTNYNLMNDTSLVMSFLLLGHTYLLSQKSTLRKKRCNHGPNTVK